MRIPERTERRAAVRRATAAGALVAALLASPASARADVPDVRTLVDRLAADDLQGRGLGTDGLTVARDSIRTWFERAGLEPGLPGGEWLQPFDAPSGPPLANVVGRIRGEGPEWIVIGAHYDGLGVGAPGSEHPFRIHPGADDNASGVAALIRIAAALSADPGERAVYVVAFTGEESGLLGSRHFVENPPTELEHLAAMVNLDTVGRVENDRLIVFGAGTAEEFPATLRGINRIFRFDLALNAEGAGASDHAPFFEKGIPVLHFFSGAKPEYHRPGDRPELVDAEATDRVADFVTELGRYLAASAEPLTFRPLGVERLRKSAGASKRRRVSFGSIPDFSQESGGILLSGVMPGGAAEAAGLLGGDVLVRIDGLAIDTIYDFQGVLSEHDPGDVVVVEYDRAGERRETKVELRERK